MYFYHPDHLGSSSYITDREGRITQHTEYIAFGEVLFEEHSTSKTMPYLFNGKELDTETGLYYYGARYYDPRVSLWLNVDPMMLRDEAMDDEDSSNGGVFNPMNNAVYTFSYQNPVKYVDPDGECPNCITAAGGALVGGFIGGGVEAGMQFYKNGKITSWKAIGGSAAQGAITGAVAGFTGGASLAVTAGVAGGANVVGGVANRAIQGKKTTATDVVVDATVGAIFGAGGKVLGDIVKKSTNNLTNSAKGFSVAQSKYDYFFGRVTTGKQHNINRSAQNLKDLSTLGIKNEKQLTNIFSKAFEKGTVISTKTNEYGTTITKSIEVSNKGAINVGFFYKGGNLNNKPTISTIIPKIYNK
ncbi:hypothetical protein MSHRCOH1_08995 [Candidatus Ornithobacterium hominis]|uniref:RHS repeat-associated core domain-containing protein n=1 Tax=Candidatus Ornithobacterium hominis TaxID=2497989 RepID=UPI0024BCFE41|nr:RHS repeat-associated core domain-containing protein [Candidatus Ornithobacterium hominis]CAI9430325.1 hypothetical protein MSHRCOH1_08995 [Candidatus Ornithobacterium hominis]